jgi:hypothetical protein
MLSLPHAALGAAIATLIPNPAISIPLSFFSHFLADYLPHWNPHLDTQLSRHGKLTPQTIAFAASDFILAVSFSAFVALTAASPLQSLNLFLSPLAAILPDLIEAPHYILGIKLPHIDKLIHHQRNNQNHVNAFPGIITQLFLFLVCLSIIF